MLTKARIKTLPGAEIPHTPQDGLIKNKKERGKTARGKKWAFKKGWLVFKLRDAVWKKGQKGVE